VISDVV